MSVKSKLTKQHLEQLKYPHFRETLAEYYKHINKEAGTIDNKPIIKYEDIPKHKIKYTSHFACKGGVHIGQRKLFLSELQFLTNYFRKNPAELKKTVYLVYAGAAPGHHTYLLASYFPNIKFILVDPNKFELRISKIGQTFYTTSAVEIKQSFKAESDRSPYLYLQSKYSDRIESINKENWIRMITANSKTRIFLIEDYFTDELAQMFAKLNPIFWSDIRTNEDEEDAPSDLDFLWNMAQQYNWCHIIKPRAIMLKFRVPFYKERELNPDQFKIKTFTDAAALGIDFIKDYYKKSFKYLDGEIYMQAFPGPTSSESRLCIFNGRLKNKLYDAAAYENNYFFYNIFSRTILHRYNPLANKDLGFDHCNDCAIEYNIWDSYNKLLISQKQPINITQSVANLSLFVNRPLRMRLHGDFYYPNLNHIFNITNYAHIEKDKIKLIIDKKIPECRNDYSYNREFIINNLLSKFLNKKQYELALYKSLSVEKNLYLNYAQVNYSVPLIFGVNFINTLCYHPGRRKFNLILRFLLQKNNSSALFYYGNIKLNTLILVSKMFSIKIYWYNPDYKGNSEQNIIIIKNINEIKEHVSFFFDGFDNKKYLTFNLKQKCEYAQKLYNLCAEIINKIKPIQSLLRLNGYTGPGCALTKHGETLPIDSNFVPISINFYQCDYWPAPYDINKGTMFNLFLDHYKKEKLSFDKISTKYMYFDTFLRRLSCFENKKANQSIGYDNCHDCSLEYHFLNQYCIKYGADYDKIFTELNKIIEINFKEGLHGHIFPENYKNDESLNKFLNGLIMKSSVLDINERMA